MTAPETYRARLRFRLQKKLNIEATEHRFRVSGREVVLSSQIVGENICESEWLVINAREFVGQEEAREFGHKLRSALDLSSAATRLGVDAGIDLATSGLGRAVKEQIAKDRGTIVRDNIHGLDVFVDGPNVRMFHLRATGTVLANPEPFLSGLDELHGIAATASQRARDVTLLLNYALMRPEPVAQIVFAFSAVEMLGQDQTWTRDQKLLLEDLANAAEQSSRGSEPERFEVSVAIRKGLHRLTLRQGVLRLLDSLGLADLRTAWDSLYAERSTLVHGLAPRPGTDYAGLANRSLNLCGRILLTAIAAEIPVADRYVDRFYELPNKAG